MKTKLFLRTLWPAAACVFVAAASVSAEPIVTVYTALAPNALGSPSWAGWKSNAIAALQSGATSMGNPALPTYFTTQGVVNASWATVTSFNSWHGQADPGTVFGPAFANEYGNRIAFPLVIDGNGTQFSISELGFTAASDDPGDALGFTFAPGSYNYSSDYVGGIINPDLSITFVTGGPNTQLVDFLWGRGSGNGLWPCGPGDLSPCSTTAEQQAAINAQADTIGGAQFTGTYSLVDPEGGLIAQGSATALLTPEPGTWLTASVAIGLLAALRRRRTA